MSVQILLQGRVAGKRDFLQRQCSEPAFLGRCHWITLLSEVLPRALITELGLSKMLLGSSGGEQFLLVLPIEVRARSEEFLRTADVDVRHLSGGSVHLLWAITENLGDWSVVRKRLNDEMQRASGAPFASGLPDFETEVDADPEAETYFEHLGSRLRDAEQVSWPAGHPARIGTGPGEVSWPVAGPSASPDSIPVARHAALTDEGNDAAGSSVLAARAAGRPAWGVLRGDVDNFGIRIRRGQAIEEHVQISVLYKQFFAGELEVLCSMPEFWRKISLLYAGGNDFAVYGAWDALIAFAREMQRLFHRFAEEHLKDYPGREGKTITMSLAVAPDENASLVAVYQQAGEKLAAVKTTDKDRMYLLGGTLEWKQIGEAAELKDDLARMVNDYGLDPQYLQELSGVYRESRASGGNERRRRPERPWRLYRKLSLVISGGRTRDFQKARTDLIADLAGRNTANLRLRPAGRVALQWAQLATERREPLNRE